MNCPVVSLSTLDDLTTYVKGLLCERDALDPAQTPLFRAPIVRRGRPWGYSFHVDGPRLVKPSAIWAAEAGTLAFFDSTGAKVREVLLTEAPTLPDIRAVPVPRARVQKPRLKRKSA
jgi:hypothetical protein